MRVLALDIGEVRTGIARGTTEVKIASPVCVLPTQELLSGAKSWQQVLQDEEPELLVCGRPTTLAGEHGKQADAVKEFAERISCACAIPLEFVDERLSSAEAKRILKEQGLSEKEMRGKIDMVAASLFLQTWLDTAV